MGKFCHGLFYSTVLINSTEIETEGAGRKKTTIVFATGSLGKIGRGVKMFQVMSPSSGQTENTLITSPDQMSISNSD